MPSIYLGLDFWGWNPYKIHEVSLGIGLKVWYMYVLQLNENVRLCFRVRLVALLFNENSNKKQAKTKEDNLQ